MNPIDVLQIEMKFTLSFSLSILLMLVAGCASGMNPIQLGKGNEIAPEDLAKLQSGSLSTIWYHGSDESFHYFSHFVKSATRYKVKREDLVWPEEFPATKDRSEFAGDNLQKILKEKENKSVDTTRAKRPELRNQRDSHYTTTLSARA